MKLLLDTHIWIWSFLEPQRLSQRAAKAINDSRHELWLSPLTTWEVLILCQKGRLELEPIPRVWIDTALKAATFREAPLTHEVCQAIERVNLPHRDPIDRLLAATALVYDLTLITADANLRSGTGFSLFRE